MKEALWGETEENRALWGETEQNGGEKKDKVRNTDLLERRREEAQERVEEVRRRNSDEEMESDDEEEDEEELNRDETDVLGSIISTAVKSDGFFRHQQVVHFLNNTVGAP